MQSAVEQDKVFDSSPTLCRLENRADRKVAIALHQVMMDQFIASFKQQPKELVLDFDATNDRVHGEQEAGSSAAIMIIIVSCPCTFFVRINC